MISIATATVALLALIVYIVGGFPATIAQGTRPFEPFFLPASAGTSPLRSVLQASALMFVAYTGYGRIATLGNEIRDPARTIPRAVVVTLIITLLLSLAVAIISIANAGALEFAELTLTTSAPLEVISATFALPGAKFIVATGAIAAMLGILLTLMFSLARVMLAMGRRKEMPVPVARVSHTTHTPETAIIAVGVLVSLLVLVGDISTIWSFSAFTALIYYAITNLGVLQLPPDKSRLPRFIPAFGLLASSFLAFWVEPGIWIMGLSIIAFGHAWRWLMRRL
jgi:basic amino acid/polyamine antiporter, APA family